MKLEKSGVKKVKGRPFEGTDVEKKHSQNLEGHVMGDQLIGISTIIPIKKGPKRGEKGRNLGGVLVFVFLVSLGVFLVGLGL